MRAGERGRVRPCQGLDERLLSTILNYHHLCCKRIIVNGISWPVSKDSKPETCRVERSTYR